MICKCKSQEKWSSTGKRMRRGIIRKRIIYINLFFVAGFSFWSTWNSWEKMNRKLILLVIKVETEEALHGRPAKRHVSCNTMLFASSTMRWFLVQLRVIPECLSNMQLNVSFFCISCTLHQGLEVMVLPRKPVYSLINRLSQTALMTHKLLKVQLRKKFIGLRRLVAVRNMNLSVQYKFSSFKVVDNGTS